MATALLFDQQAIVSELNDAFGVFNRELFSSQLQRPTFRFDIEKKWSFRVQPPFDFVIGKGIAELSVKQVLCELLHEMVHLFNLQLDVQDSTSNGYHNQCFADVALDVGLYVGKHRNHGWGITTLGPEITADEIQVPTDEASETLHSAIRQIERTFRIAALRETQRWLYQHLSVKVAKVYQLKYICGCPEPYNSIRSGRRPSGDHALRAVCLTCGEQFSPA